MRIILAIIILLLVANFFIMPEEEMWDLTWPIVVLLVGFFFSYHGYKQFKKTGSRHLLNASPGIFTSLGILGTFLSICISLWNVNINNFKLGTVINELIPAFTTSIAGIVGAIVVTIFNKYKFAQQDTALDVRLGTPEENIHKMVVYLGNLSKLDNITSNLNRILANQNDAKTAISNKLNELLTAFTAQETVNTELTNRLAQTISQQYAIFQQFITNFIAKVDEIFDNMKESIQKQMTDFGERQFNESRVTVERLMSRLSETSEALLAAQSTTTAESLSRTNAVLVEMSTKISDSLAHLGETNNSKMDSIMQAQTEKMQALLDSMNTQTARLSDATKVQAETLQKTVQESYNAILQHNSDSLTQMESKIQDVCKQLSDNVRKYLESLRENYDFMNNQAATIKSNYEQAALSFTDAVEIAHDSNRTQERLIKEINTSLGCVSETNDNIARVLSLIEDRQENLDRLVQRINEVSRAVEALQELESTLQRVIVK